MATKAKKTAKAEPVRETLAEFKGESQVTHITDGDREAWLSTTTGFTSLVKQLGADSIDVSEDGTRIFFYSGDEELASYRLSNSLQEEEPEPDDLLEMKHSLVFFKSWYPEESRWVNNCAKGQRRAKSSKAVSIR